MSAPIRACHFLRSFARRPIKPTFKHYGIARSIFNKEENIFIRKLHSGSISAVPIYETNNNKVPWSPRRGFTTSAQCRQTESTATEDVEEEYHTIIKDTEQSTGPADTHEFQAETRKLLDIVARSLYSEKEVFIRELISNSSDALEKLRYLQMTSDDITDKDTPLEIHIRTDEAKKTFTIQDTGLGMTKAEMIQNLGTIARSGSKDFLESIGSDAGGGVDQNIIGQFGVGFYSSFMVGEKVDVYSQSYLPGEQAFKWSSDGTGVYDMQQADGVQRGSKIVIHLKGSSYEFCQEELIKEVVKKYSNFVGVPIYLNGKRANIIQALWMMEPKDITEDMHEEFYKFVSNAFDRPRYHFHYKTDAPLNIRALFYIPDYKPTMFDMSRDTEVSLQLYSRKVMIMSKATHILPKWLRFVKGVVDSEDIPLNLSRELLQDSALIRKLRLVLSTRIIKFLSDQSRRDPVNYQEFYESYGLFLREGIITEPEQSTREDISRLLRFESSKCPPGEKVRLEDYCSRMKAGTRNIYYLTAPSRELAETSPYLEALTKRDMEVLFLYEPYDELVLMNLGQFDKKDLKSVENELVDDKKHTNKVDEKDESSLKQSEVDTLIAWLKGTLVNRVNEVKVTLRLSSHPCIITVQEMGAARHFLKTSLADKSQEERFRLLQPTLEINPSHPLIKKLQILQSTDPQLAKLVAEQLYDNAMVSAGLLDDPRSMVNRLNQLLERALDKV